MFSLCMSLLTSPWSLVPCPFPEEGYPCSLVSGLSSFPRGGREGRRHPCPGPDWGREGKESVTPVRSPPLSTQLGPRQGYTPLTPGVHTADRIPRGWCASCVFTQEDFLVSELRLRLQHVQRDSRGNSRAVRWMNSTLCRCWLLGCRGC